VYDGGLHRSLLLVALASLVAACSEQQDQPPRASAGTHGAILPLSTESVYVETGACPGECCVYGRWRTSHAVALHARADSTSEIVARLDSGTLVNALTGAVHIRPGRMVLDTAVDPAFRPGDTLGIYSDAGEGYRRVRRAGSADSLVPVPLYPLDTLCVGTPDARCQGTLLYAPVEVWWTRVEAPGGIVAWSAEPERFDGMDACGVYEPPIPQGPLAR
jgi:hypothetical protein